MFKGKTVVITRPIHQAEDLVDLVKKRGGLPRVVPTVEIGLISNLNNVIEPLDLISNRKVDIIIFMSQNGVSSFFRIAEILKKTESIKNSLRKIQVVAIGVKTKKMLESNGINVDITPTDHSSIGLANVLRQLNISNKVIALPRTDKPTDYLNKKISEMSGKIIQFATYETRMPASPKDVLKLIEDILEGHVDIITFTSSATALNLIKIAQENSLKDDLIDALNNKTIVVTIGPVTRETLEKKGISVKVMPNEYTIEKMMEALDKYIKKFNNKLDNIDNKLLSIIQNDVPLTVDPWTDIASKLGIDKSEVLNRLNQLKMIGIIRKIGPVIDARKVGLTASTLVGMKVPSERVEEVANIINNYDEVSHNYERPHEYNIWFTVTSSSHNEVERILHEISEKSGINLNSILNLQTEHLFKIKPNFSVGEKLL